MESLDTNMDSQLQVLDGRRGSMQSWMVSVCMDGRRALIQIWMVTFKAEMDEEARLTLCIDQWRGYVESWMVIVSTKMDGEVRCKAGSLGSS